MAIKYTQVKEVWRVVKGSKAKPYYVLNKKKMFVKNKAAINRSESDCCISIDWLDDNKYDPYRQSNIAIQIIQWTCFLIINLEIIPTKGT